MDPLATEPALGTVEQAFSRWTIRHPSLMCPSCQAVLDLASVYRMLADQFEAERQRGYAAE